MPVILLGTSSWGNAVLLAEMIHNFYNRAGKDELDTEILLPHMTNWLVSLIFRLLHIIGVSWLLLLASFLICTEP